MKTLVALLISLILLSCAESEREETRDCYKSNATGAWAQIVYYPEENGMINQKTFDDACQLIIDVYESNTDEE